METVLHITAHMGGGVGKILSSLATYKENKYKHKIVLLEKPQKNNFYDICIQHNIDICICEDVERIFELMDEADIVQIEWWHHPKMAELLSKFNGEICRLIVWSHVSGCNYPFLPFEFVKRVPFMFTSKYSVENSMWTDEQREYAENNCNIVNSAGIIKTEKSEKKKNEFFNIGYVGTLNYSKLNPNFVEFCKAINIPNAHFIIVGDKTNEYDIREKARNVGIEEKIEFVGYTDNVEAQLSRFDVFGYILNPFHFGTTENALLESMEAGICPICLNQNTEKHIIQNGKTGILVNSIKEYGEAVRYLYNNVNEREILGYNARNYIKDNFSISQTVLKIEHVYDDLMKTEKKEYYFSNIFGQEPYEWFLSCLYPEDKQMFLNSLEEHISLDLEEILKNCRYILRDKSKSSIVQFYEYYSNDRILSRWNNIILKI